MRYNSRSSRSGAGHYADRAIWHIRFRAELVVYGHLHIPRTTHYDGVRFEEVSLGYPREWSNRGKLPKPKKVLPG